MQGNGRIEQLAEEFAENLGVPVEDWMLWEGWKSHVGCESCAILGPEADCWGFAGCHGYFRGCGCEDCMKKQEEELLRGIER
ncbi:MAG: hypothetical protein ACPLTR_12230 [Thermacetogeniaceae bacterium]